MVRSARVDGSEVSSAGSSASIRQFPTSVRAIRSGNSVNLAQLFKRFNNTLAQEIRTDKDANLAQGVARLMRKECRKFCTRLHNLAQNWDRNPAQDDGRDETLGQTWRTLVQPCARLRKVASIPCAMFIFLRIMPVDRHRTEFFFMILVQLLFPFVGTPAHPCPTNEGQRQGEWESQTYRSS